jgi:transcriptional regulator with XRE-family HTH domain
LQGIVHTRAHKALVATIKAYLAESGLEQREFAERCKRDEKWASRVLNGHSGIQGGDIPKIVKALGTTLPQFAKRWSAILAT